ncbi:MAG: ATP-grasp domain-containing protein [Bdellovibrionales bacterium]|nr:ATP-grasp domain-containing protein [Bdellovibrionales bacterium]
MNRPVVIVDPRSSGVELAPAFKARKIPAIAITFKPTKSRLGFGTEVQASDFIEIIPKQPNLVDILRKYDPFAIIPGAEAGVPLAESLAVALTPQFANDNKKLLNRLHKAQMQKALEEAGVPSLKTLSTSSEGEVEDWIKENDLVEVPLIIKPPISAGSEKVFHIPAQGNWKKAFNEILTEPSNITGKFNETVVVQEQAIGTEFAIGTVSANGQHYLAHLIQYNKISFNGRDTIYDYVEFVPFLEEVHGRLLEYTRQALDALGVRWGAAHNEVIFTTKGPRLIESVPRMCGGPVVQFAREATGSSQADKLVEVFVDGDVQTKEYEFKKSVVPVFLKSPAEGIVSNAEIFEKTSKLSTFFKQFIWFKNGNHVPQTMDYLTSIGIVALAGDRESIFEDYQRVRDMESQLVIHRLNRE